MRSYNIDTIIKGELLRHGLSIHYYPQRAYLAMDFIRSMNFDSAYVVKTAVLTITDNSVTLPSDFVGLVRIGIKNGQYMKTLQPDVNLIDNTEAASEGVQDYTWYYPNLNKYGENLGGYFGYTHISQNSYKILYDDNKILINNVITGAYDDIYLEYTSDGMESGSAAYGTGTSVYIHPYAVDAMKAYMDWKTSMEGNRFVNRELKDQYYTELRKYRSRLNGLTADQIRRILRKNYTASPKS